MSFSDDLREILHKYTAEINELYREPEEADDQAIAAITKLVEEKKLKARIIELDLLELVLNRGDNLEAYKLVRLNDLTERLAKLHEGSEK